MIDRRFSIATLLVALATAALLSVVPTHRGESCSATSDSPEMLCESTTSSLLEHEGTSVLLVLLVPAFIAAVAVVLPGLRTLRGVAIALTACMVLGAMSIGIFFLPTVLAAWLAVLRSTTARPA